MAMPATQIRRGMVIVFEGAPCRVLEFRHHTPGNLRAMIQTKMKNLRSGNSFEHRFRAADTIEKASMETHELEFMYQGGDTWHFMNTENYDQLEMAGMAALRSRGRERPPSWRSGRGESCETKNPGAMATGRSRFSICFTWLQ